MNSSRGLRVFAVKSDRDEQINIYLDFSGRKEYLMSHKESEALYETLKNGISVEELRRNKKHLLIKNSFVLDDWDGFGTIIGHARAGKGYIKRLENQMDHILQEIDEYIEDLEQDYDDGERHVA